jgi:glycosyltransferase involved in cell wall biosynthesis
VSQRIVVYGSDSGLEIWAPALSQIPGYEACCVAEHSSDNILAGLLRARSLGDVRRAARGARAIVAISALLGALVAVTGSRSPVVAIDVGAVRLAQTHRRVGRLPVALVLRLPTLVVGVSEAHGKALEALRPRRIRVVRQPARQPGCRWDPNRRAPYVLTVGTSGRDLGLLSEAARGLPFDALIVEGGWELVPARARSIPEDVPSNVKVQGRVDRDEYLRLLAGASAVVLPLQQSDYPVGITVLLDAMAAGVPVVATAVHSIAEYQGDETAFLVPAGDAAALAVALRVAVEDHDRATEVAEAARHHVARIAAPEVVGAQFAGILAGLA